MSYRPITDFWLLARPKTKHKGKSYYGAYPTGFLARARQLLVGGDPDAAILHVCGGTVAQNDGRKIGGIILSGYGPNDRTVDLDPELNPDYLVDVSKYLWFEEIDRIQKDFYPEHYPFDAVLIDRPYTEADADHYKPGREKLPNLNKLVAESFELVKDGGTVGAIDYLWPSVKGATEVFAVAVSCGRNNRIRIFTGWRR